MEAPEITFSVITPSYNQAKFISETIESVISQSGEFSIEYIIIDGGSDDNSIEIIKKYERLLREGNWPVKCNKIEFVWKSENDEGHGDAINKGFLIAKGDILSFLNSDDIYEPGALQTVLEQFRSDKDMDVLYGNAFYIDERSKISALYSSADINQEDIYHRCFICQPTLFMKKKVFRNVGLFNIHIKNSLDYDYWLRIYSESKYKFTFIRQVLASSRMYGENKTSRNRKEIYLEYFATMKEYNKKIRKPWKYHFARETSLLVKFLLEIFGLVDRSKNLVVKIYSQLYFVFNQNNISKMHKKIFRN